MNNDLLKRIKANAIENHIPIIMDDTLAVLQQIFSEEKPKNMLEIGTAVGYSAICFSEYISEIDTIEKDSERAQEAIKNIKNMKLQDNIKLFVGDAVEILPTIEKSYDVVFIDASKGKYPFFLEQALRLTHKNSIIIADNVLYKGYVLSDYNKHKQRTAVRNLREFLKNIQDNSELDSKLLEVGDGLMVCKKLIN